MAVESKCKNLERRDIAADQMRWRKELPKKMGSTQTGQEEEELKEGIPGGREENRKGAT